MTAQTANNISEFPVGGNQNLIAQLLVLDHFVQKSTLEKLSGMPGYEKLSLSYEGYISLLAERAYAPGELATCLGVSKQLCSKVLRELEQQGFTERCRNPRDSRSSLVSLSEKGRKLLQDGMDATRALHEGFAEQLGVENLQALMEILEKTCRRLAIDIPGYPVVENITRDMAHGWLSKMHALLSGINSYCRHRISASLQRAGYPGLRSGLGQVMGVISREGRKIQYIASIIGVSKQSVAATVVELETLGYVLREKDPTDARQIVVRLSESGQALLRRATAEVQALEVSIEASLDSQEFSQLRLATAQLYGVIAQHYDPVSVLPKRIQQLSKQLIEELGVTGARALAQQLLVKTRGNH